MNLPKFDIDFNGWHVEGDFFEWDYQIMILQVQLQQQYHKDY